MEATLKSNWPDQLRDIERWLSEPRMRPYMALATADPTRAFELYRWNLVLSAATYEALHVVEVILRNAMDRELRLWNGSVADRTGVTRDQNWVENPHPALGTVLGRDREKAIDRARTALTRSQRAGEDPCHDDLVAQLTLGTWRFLLPAANPRKKPFKSQLWDECLGRAFPHLGRPVRGLVSDVEAIWHLRNRVAHLEPIHRSAVRAHDAMARVVADIDPTASAWFMDQSRVPGVLALDPRANRQGN